jgi:hypothetical protein
MSAAAAEKQIVFVARCPLGDCSKKFGVLAKRDTEEGAREAVKWHLMKSPYHEMPESDADLQMLAAEIEEWPAANDVESWEDGDEWFQKRKKPRTATGSDEQKVQAAALKLLADRVLSGGGQSHASSSGSGGADTLSLALRRSNIVLENPAKIQLNASQLKACIDSLRRAKTAAESACLLCGKAARAFGEEAACIQSCQDVLESYLL